MDELNNVNMTELFDAIRTLSNACNQIKALLDSENFDDFEEYHRMIIKLGEMNYELHLLEEFYIRYRGK